MRSYVVELEDVWKRAVDMTIWGCAFRVPELPDHLLLMIMQLPYHLWPPRLLVDIACLLRRWGRAIDWLALLERASAWRMHALAASAVCVVTSLLGVDIPEHVQRLIVLNGYLRRVQRTAARRVAVERLFGENP